METTNAPDHPVPLDYGETVDIIIQGARVTYTDDQNLHLSYPISNPDNNGGRDVHYLTIDPTEPAVTVVRTIPADGQPQAGDLWRDRHGKLYAAVAPASELEEQELGLLLKPVNGRGRYAPWVVIHGDPSLGPITLEYRPQPTAQEIAAAALTPDAEAVPA